MSNQSVKVLTRRPDEAPGSDVASAAGSPAACCAPLAVEALSTKDAAAIAPMFKALGDPVRLRLMPLIASQPEACVCELTEAFELSGPTISLHLNLLREAGLVNHQRQGTWVDYWARPEAMRQLGALLELTATP